MSQSGKRAYFYVLISMIFWAFSFVWIKIAYESFNPISTIFFRLIISASLLMTFLKATKKLQKIAKEDLKTIITLAFFEPFLYFMGESFGLKLVSSTLAAVLISTIPLITPIFAFFIYGEKLSVTNIIGLLVSFFGVGIMIFENGFRLNASLLGILLMLIAVLSGIGYAITLKKLAFKYSPMNIIAYQNTIGIIMFVPVFLFLDFKTLTDIQFNTQSVLAVIQLAIFASSLAFIFFTKSLKILGVSRANMFTNLIPVFTAIFAWWLRGDSIDLEKIIGIAIVIIGLFISQIKFKKWNLT